MLFSAPSIRLVEKTRRETQRSTAMTELIDELGPVGWLVVVKGSSMTDHFMNEIERGG
jgi:hypothetical protein